MKSFRVYGVHLQTQAFSHKWSSLGIPKLLTLLIHKCLVYESIMSRLCKNNHTVENRSQSGLVHSFQCRMHVGQGLLISSFVGH